MLLEHFFDVRPVGVAFEQRDEVLGCHNLLYEHVHVFLEADVTVGDYSGQAAVFAYYRDAADVVGVHHSQGLAHSLVFVDGERVADHSALGPLDLAHLGCLVGGGHILVNDTDAAFAGKGYGHCCFRYGVHCGGHYGDVESDVP